MSIRTATLTFLDDNLSLQPGPAPGAEEATVSYPDPELVLQEAGPAVQQAINLLFGAWYKGDPGNGIASIVYNADYSMTITLTDGTHATTSPLRGATGVGIASIVSNPDYTLSITLSDGRICRTASVRGQQGVPGPNQVNTTTDTNISGLLKGAAGKVAQAVAGTDYVAPESGKGLSSNDYTTGEKTKLAGLSNYDDTALSARVSAVENMIGDVETLLEGLL